MNLLDLNVRNAKDYDLFIERVQISGNTIVKMQQINKIIMC